VPPVSSARGDRSHATTSLVKPQAQLQKKKGEVGMSDEEHDDFDLDEDDEGSTDI
jgi:hypothetical protein